MSVRLTLERVRRHLANPESYHRKIVTGFAWVSLFVFAGKLAGAAKEMAIAWRYGVSETVDAYVLLFNFVSWPVGLWLSMLGLVLVPLMANLRQGDRSSLKSFGGELFGMTLLASLVVGAVGYFALRFVLESNALGLSASALREAMDMAAPLSLLLPIGIVVSLFSAWVMGYGRHVNTVLEGIPSMLLLIVLLLPQDWVPRPLVWGSVLGALLHVLCLAFLLRGMHALPAPTPTLRSPAWSQFWSGLGVIGLGQALMSLTVIVDQVFAARLGAGALATFNYSSRIVALVLALGATAIGRATLPIFAEIVASHRPAELRAVAVRWATWMFAAGLFAAAVGWLLAPLIVQVLFERGAFSANDTASVAEVFRYALTQLPFFFANTVLVSLLAARGEYRAIAFMSSANLVVKVVGILALVGSLGINAIALSATLMYAVTLLFFARTIRSAGQ